MVKYRKCVSKYYMIQNKQKHKATKNRMEKNVKKNNLARLKKETIHPP